MGGPILAFGGFWPTDPPIRSENGIYSRSREMEAAFREGPLLSREGRQLPLCMQRVVVKVPDNLGAPVGL